MLTQEQIAAKIFEELLKIQEEFGDEIALAFLSGMKFAANLHAELIGVHVTSDNGNFTEFAINMAEFYSKGEIS